MVADALSRNPLLLDKDTPEAVIAAFSGCTEAFCLTVVTCAAVVTWERSRAAARTEDQACKHAPLLEKPPVKPLSTLDQGGREGQSPTRQVWDAKYWPAQCGRCTPSR